MLASSLLLVHLLSFAAFVGAAVAQQSLMKSSASPQIAPDVRSDREALAAGVATKFALPALLGATLSGLAFVGMAPILMKQGWLHGKLLCVVLLLVVAHLEMFNARKIVRARAANAVDEVAARKKRHAVFGAISKGLIAAILIFVTYVRLGA